ncbi:MAG: FHA domain-containing protein [Kiritimatiellae bacterium]|nr:FHA domain-containing protein [Kiritimatiellia bacterium]
MIFRLVILNGPRQGERITVPLEPLLVGRAPECSLRLDDPEVAERHAVIEHFQGGLLIHDLGSMNRILVNKRETARSILKHGDEIELGRTRLLVQAFVQAEVKGRPAELIDEAPVGRGMRVALVLIVVVLAVLAVGRAVVRRPSPRFPAEPSSLAATSAVPAIAIELPPPSPAPPATPVIVVTSAAPDEATVEEIRRLRAELALLQSSFRAMATQAAATAGSTRPSTSPPPAAAATAAPPTRAELSARTLARARAEAAAGRWEAADRLLAELQREDPDLLAAYELRATWLEQRGQIEAALAQWAQLYQRAADRPEAARAAEEWARLSLEQRRAGTARAGRVTVAELTIQRFPDSQDYDDMRLVRIVLRSSGTQPPPPASLRVEVVMFDESADGRTVALTRAMPAQVRAWVGEAWSAEGTLNASAAYVVPAGFRRQSATRFHGCIVRVYCDDRLEDEIARPMDLLIRASAGVRASL